jgi:hypothetical protein
MEWTRRFEHLRFNEIIAFLVVAMGLPELRTLSNRTAIALLQMNDDDRSLNPIIPPVVVMLASIDRTSP